MFNLNGEKTKNSIEGNFILKGIIKVIDDDNNFEVIKEDFFYTGLEEDGQFLSQNDINVYLKDVLIDYNWNILVEVDKHYSVLFEFNFDSDCDIECENLNIIPFSEKANELYNI